MKENRNSVKFSKKIRSPKQDCHPSVIHFPTPHPSFLIPRFQDLDATMASRKARTRMAVASFTQKAAVETNPQQHEQQ